MGDLERVRDRLLELACAAGWGRLNGQDAADIVLEELSEELHKLAADIRPVTSGETVRARARYEAQEVLGGS